jgi:hypothetical protein
MQWCKLCEVWMCVSTAVSIGVRRSVVCEKCEFKWMDDSEIMDESIIILKNNNLHRISYMNTKENNQLVHSSLLKTMSKHGVGKTKP